MTVVRTFWMQWAAEDPVSGMAWFTDLEAAGWRRVVNHPRYSGVWLMRRDEGGE